MIKLKTKEEIEILKEGGQKLALILSELSKEVKVGVSTADLDQKARALAEKSGGRPAFLNFTPSGADRPYPAAICISINDEIVHGIPNENPKILESGDLVNLDMGLIYKGLYTDHAVTVVAGKLEDKYTKEEIKDIKKLISKTEEALYAGIKAARVGHTIGDIGNAISKIARENDLFVMEGLTGHGVGYEVHEDPYVPNEGEKGEGDKLVAGMVLALEPMFSLGTSRIKLGKDGYTYSTKDGSLSVQFEHTIVITENGPVILTRK